MLRALAQSFVSFAGRKLEAPSFIEMMYPEQKQNEMTKDEIIARTLALFSE